MKRRREHGECDTREGGRGCLVFGTGVCTFRKKKMGKFGEMRRFLERWRVVLLWICAAVLGVLVAWGWMEMRRLNERPLVVES
jgi:hypothetical protein